MELQTQHKIDQNFKSIKIIHHVAFPAQQPVLRTQRSERGGRDRPVEKDIEITINIGVPT